MMKRFAWVLAPALILTVPRFATAVDHNNIDAGRPLSFDDAETIAFREFSMEMGPSLVFPYRQHTGLALDAEFLYGFALNTHAGVGVEAVAGGRAGSAETDFAVEALDVNVLRNFNREYGNVPAFSLRADAVFTPDGSRKGAEVRLRAIASRALVQYDRLHLNLDAVVATSPEEGERGFRPGAVLGYTRPLGYPRRFDRTGLAEVAVHASETESAGAVTSLGVGVRQQITVRSVVDVGIRADIAASRREAHDDVTVVAGYSIGF